MRGVRFAALIEVPPGCFKIGLADPLEIGRNSFTANGGQRIAVERKQMGVSQLDAGLDSARGNQRRNNQERAILCP